MSNPFTALTSRVLPHLAEARALRAEAMRLRTELASYRTDSERAELHAIFSRHTAEDLDLLAEKAGGRSWAA